MLVTPGLYCSITSGAGCPYVLSEVCGGHSLRIPLLSLPTLYLRWRESIGLQVCPSSTFHQRLIYLINKTKQIKKPLNLACPRGLVNRSVIFQKYLLLSQISVCAAVAAADSFVSVKPVMLTCTSVFLPSSSQPKTTETVSTWFSIIATINFDGEACSAINIPIAFCYW